MELFILDRQIYCFNQNYPMIKVQQNFCKTRYRAALYQKYPTKTLLLLEINNFYSLM